MEFNFFDYLKKLLKLKTVAVACVIFGILMGLMFGYFKKPNVRNSNEFTLLEASYKSSVLLTVNTQSALGGNQIAVNLANFVGSRNFASELFDKVKDKFKDKAYLDDDKLFPFKTVNWFMNFVSARTFGNNDFAIDITSINNDFSYEVALLAKDLIIAKAGAGVGTSQEVQMSVEVLVDAVLVDEYGLAELIEKGLRTKEGKKIYYYFDNVLEKDVRVALAKNSAPMLYKFGHYYMQRGVIYFELIKNDTEFDVRKEIAFDNSSKAKEVVRSTIFGGVIAMILFCGAMVFVVAFDKRVQGKAMLERNLNVKFLGELDWRNLR